MKGTERRELSFCRLNFSQCGDDPVRRRAFHIRKNRFLFYGRHNKSDAAMEDDMQIKNILDHIPMYDEKKKYTSEQGRQKLVSGCTCSTHGRHLMGPTNT
jgi:hypothetical protein